MEWLVQSLECQAQGFMFWKSNVDGSNCYFNF